MRLIDASKLIQLLCINMDSGEQFNIATHCVDVMPTVDAVPVRHGKWITHNGMSLDENTEVTWYECDQCGHFNWDGSKYPYCPNCGARMDEE